MCPNVVPMVIAPDIQLVSAFRGSKVTLSRAVVDIIVPEALRTLGQG